MILETTFLIDLLRADKGALQKAEEIDKKNVPALVTSISVYEIWKGSDLIKNEERKAKISRLLDSLGLINFDVGSAKVAGELHRSLRAKGISADPEDVMIAGIAKNNAETLLTRDKLFPKIEGLKIETY